VEFQLQNIKERKLTNKGQFTSIKIKNIDVKKEQSDFIWHLIKDYEEPLVIPSTHMPNPISFMTPPINPIIISHL
jgi:hypothetical protein